MEKFKSRLVFLVVIIVAILVFVFFRAMPAFIESPFYSDQIIQRQQAMTRLLKSSSEIQKTWHEGEDSIEWQVVKRECLQKLNIKDSFDESLLRCNPILIECVNEFYNKKKFELKSKNSYRYLNKSNSNLLNLKNGGYLFTLRDHASEETLDVFLNDSCHESYLEQRIYGYADMPKKSDGEDYRFDNFDQNIYLDKHLVTNREVDEWIKFGIDHDSKNLALHQSSDFFSPSVDLTLPQMNAYCEFRGAELMNAHIFDAATFLPMDSLDTTPKIVLRSSYFWTKKNSEKTDRCDFIFTKECLGKNKFKTNSVLPTWQGIFDSMGGVMEAFKNPIESELNLKVSSFYLERNSIWHKLGVRSSWTGEGNELRYFSLEKIEIDKIHERLQVGFRCMRRVE